MDEPTIVAVTYLDHTFEFNRGDADIPKFMTVYGVETPSEFPGFVAIVSETCSDGDERAVTHVLESTITERRVLRQGG